MTGGKFRVVPINPVVMEAKTIRQPVEEPALHWIVGFAPEREESAGGRVVFGTIHAESSTGIAEVTVASIMSYPEEAEPAEGEFSHALAESDGLETLYDVARLAFRTIVALTDLDLDLPTNAPEPELGELVLAAGESDEPQDE